MSQTYVFAPTLTAAVRCGGRRNGDSGSAAAAGGVASVACSVIVLTSSVAPPFSRTIFSVAAAVGFSFTKNGTTTPFGGFWPTLALAVSKPPASAAPWRNRTVVRGRNRCAGSPVAA